MTAGHQRLETRLRTIAVALGGPIAAAGVLGRRRAHRRGDAWTTTLKAVVSRSDTEIVVTKYRPAAQVRPHRGSLERGRQGHPAGHNGFLSRSGPGVSPEGPERSGGRRSR